LSPYRLGAILLDTTSRFRKPNGWLGRRHCLDPPRIWPNCAVRRP
jgi:hypothetical protein